MQPSAASGRAVDYRLFPAWLLFAPRRDCGHHDTQTVHPCGHVGVAGVDLFLRRHYHLIARDFDLAPPLPRLPHWNHLSVDALVRLVFLNAWRAAGDTFAWAEYGVIINADSAADR